jgi:LuxR family maltose regulon positive regulatory protein
MRPFYDLGRPVRELLGASVGRCGGSEGFLADLLAAWVAAQNWQDVTATTMDALGERSRPVHLAVPLTVREIELLRDLPSLLTTDEIAVQHMVSVNTVKTHLRSLYRKLEAPNRREAVAAARRLGLL